MARKKPPRRVSCLWPARSATPCLRTSCACENLNRQVRRRTAAAGLFRNEASLLRLVSAILTFDILNFFPHPHSPL